MKRIIFIDGGAGRVISSIPSLIKHINTHPDDDVKIIIGGWDNLLWGIPELQHITYSMEYKGLFDNIIKDADEVLSPEPYRLPSYFNQKTSLAEAFDEIINKTNDHSDLQNPKLVLNKAEEKTAANAIAEVKKNQQKQKTIVIQPFGKSATRADDRDIIDQSTRSIEPYVYINLVKKLSVKYNLVFFGEESHHLNEDSFTAKFRGDLRFWSAIIEASDYFIGCDSVGQHMARSFDKPGTVLIGSTFPINTSYPDHFNIVEKTDVEKVFSPIRMSGFDSHLADRLNENTMEYSTEEINEIYNLIVSDIESKVK